MDQSSRHHHEADALRKPYGPSTAKEWWSISEATNALLARRCTSTELTELMLQRIATIDRDLRSYMTVTDKAAREAAQRADERIRYGVSLGPLDGVPLAVKDMFSTEGTRTTCGTLLFSEYMPKQDATVVTRLKEAGAVILGKLNQTEGAMIRYHPDLPVPLNPWNKKRWPGSSSSGAAIAAAAGLAYGTIGTDTGGSIRYPSASCGVAGLKPTFGRISRFNVFPLAESLDHVGIIGRCVSDCAIVFESIAGYDARDPTSLAAPVPQISRWLNRDLKDVRIGWDEAFASDGVEPQLSEMITESIRILAKLGATIVNVSVPDLSVYGETWVTLCAAEAVVAHSAYYPARSEEYGPGFREWLEFGSSIRPSEFVKAVYQRNSCIGELRKLFTDIDALVCPTTDGPPPEITTEEQIGLFPRTFYDGHWGRFTAVFNLAGLPTLSLPCGFDRSGLPLSLQLIGDHEAEALICQVGHSFECATPFCGIHPSI